MPDETLVSGTDGVDNPILVFSAAKDQSIPVTPLPGGEVCPTCKGLRCVATHGNSRTNAVAFTFKVSHDIQPGTRVICIECSMYIGVSVEHMKTRAFEPIPQEKLSFPTS